MVFKSKAALSVMTMVAVGTLASFTPQADAAYRRGHSSECHNYYNNAGTSLYNGSSLSNYGTSTVGIYCPVATDGYLPHNAVATLNVHGYTPSGYYNQSRACVKNYDNTSNACGVAKTWGASESGVVGLDVSAWTSNPYDFPYIYSTISPGGRLYGFFMTN